MAFNFFHSPYEILIFCVIISNVFSLGTPSIDSVSVINETRSTDKDISFLKVYLLFEGSDLSEDLRVRPLIDNDQLSRDCIYDNNSLPEFSVEWSNTTSSVVSIVFSEPLYFANKFSLCVSDKSGANNFNQSSLKWLKQNSDAVFRTRPFCESVNDSHIEVKNLKRIRRDNANLKERLKLSLYGVRLEFSNPPASSEDDGDAEPTLLVGSEARYRLFGVGWTKNIGFVWTELEGEPGSQCKRITGEETKIDGPFNETDTSVLVNLKVPKPLNNENSATLYFCYFEENNNTTDRQYLHLGTSPYLRIKIRERVIPLWLQLVIICVCLTFSSLFSGLNLGLLSLNKTDLRIISNTGTETEKRYAKAIYPVRVHGNYLLCSILLGNVLVNSIFTILLDDLSSGLFAVVVSTLCIVICGEICPQAVCSRHGLAIGAKTIYITKAVMVITAPLAWPLSTLLDWILGEEIATAYTRERLKELIQVTTEYNDLERDEVNIISGALELRRKTVGEVMTKIEDVYMLSYDTILDFETVSEIMKSGFSRIPVYEGTRRNIVSLLYIKDLALIDPDDCTPLKTLSQFYQNSCYYVFEDTTLDVVFKQFKEGAKGHMAFVHTVNNEGDGDPFYETVGIVTLEDVIEELIQAEIMDETDVYTDNRSKQRRSERMLRNADFSMFAERNENQRVHISPQLHLAAFQFLSSSVDAFKPEHISESVLTRLLKQDVIFHIKMKDKEKMKDDSSCIIYQQGKQADYFVLILEGRVQVTIGRENLLFENGPFTYFGSQSLIPNIGVAESPTNNATQPMGSLQSVNLESMMRYSFIPDYTVKAVSEVFYLRIKRSMYLGAKKATLMEKSKKVSNAGEQFDDEVERLLHNGGEEDSKSQLSHDGSYANQQNIQLIENNNNPNSTTQRGNVNNGVIASGVSPSRTPLSTEQTEENTTLLGNQTRQGDRNESSS